MEEKVYVVVGGEYGMQKVYALFRSKEKAEKYVNYNGMMFRVEEHFLDSEKMEQVKKVWKVSFYINTEELYDCNVVHHLYEGQDCIDIFEVSGLNSSKKCHFYILETNMNDAINVAKERLENVKKKWSTFYRKAFVKKDDRLDAYPVVDYFTGEEKKY